MTEPQFDELKRLLQKNLSLSQENHELMRRIRKFQILASLWTWFKIIIFVLTIAAGFIYLPGFIREKLEFLEKETAANGAGYILQKFGFDPQVFETTKTRR